MPHSRRVFLLAGLLMSMGLLFAQRADRATITNEYVFGVDSSGISSPFL